MPIWKIFHGPDAFNDAADKHALAKSATDYYISRGLPAYYVNVQFWPLSPENYYTGGNPIIKTVFVEILHVARHWDTKDKEWATNLKNRIDAVLRPFTIDREYHLEFVVQEGPVELWRINGIDPPESFGPDEQGAAAVNKKHLDDLRKNPS